MPFPAEKLDVPDLERDFKKLSLETSFQADVVVQLPAGGTLSAAGAEEDAASAWKVQRNNGPVLFFSKDELLHDPEGSEFPLGNLDLVAMILEIWQVTCTPYRP